MAILGKDTLVLPRRDGHMMELGTVLHKQMTSIEKRIPKGYTVISIRKK